MSYVEPPRVTGGSRVIYEVYRELQEITHKIRDKPRMVGHVLHFIKAYLDFNDRELSGEMVMVFHRGDLVKVKKELPEKWD